MSGGITAILRRNQSAGGKMVPSRSQRHDVGGHRETRENPKNLGGVIEEEEERRYEAGAEVEGKRKGGEGFFFGSVASSSPV